MNEKKPVLQAFGGVRGIALLVAGFALFLAMQAWQRQGSASAIGGVAEERGLEFESNGRRHTAQGNLDGVGVTLKTTYENLGGDTEIYTDILLVVPYAPPGRIAAASLRRKAIEKVSGDERLLTGDTAFDEAVYVVGPPGEMLAHLDADARTAIAAATAKGWALKEQSTWMWREAGHVHDIDRLRTTLDLGLVAASASRMEGDIKETLQERAEADPEPGVRAAAEAALSGSSATPAPAIATISPADAADALQDPERAFEAALGLADAGDDRQVVRNALISGLLSPDTQARAIEALAKVGGPVEAAALTVVKGEHLAAAQAAIATIRARN